MILMGKSKDLESYCLFINSDPTWTGLGLDWGVQQPPEPWHNPACSFACRSQRQFIIHTMFCHRIISMVIYNLVSFAFLSWKMAYFSWETVLWVQKLLLWMMNMFWVRKMCVLPLLITSKYCSVSRLSTGAPCLWPTDTVALSSRTFLCFTKKICDERETSNIFQMFIDCLITLLYC